MYKHTTTASTQGQDKQGSHVMDGVFHVRDQEMQHTHRNIARLTLEAGKTLMGSLFIVVSVVLARRVKSKVKLIQVCMKFVVD